MIFSNKPPSVSIPKESGVTSSSSTSLTSPASTPPWIAAPIATTSSGFTDLFGSLPSSFLTISWTAGIRVEPPTSKTWWISELVIFASWRARCTGSLARSTKSAVNSSNLARVRVSSKCTGPACPIEMKGSEIWVWVRPDKSFFAFSAASFRRCIAERSFERSTEVSRLNFSIK